MVGQKLNTFNTWFPIAVAYLLLNATRLRISADQILELNSMAGQWIPRWTKYSNMASQTHGSIDDINKLYDTDNGYMDRVKMQLKYDMNVELSGDDIATLGIHVDADKRGEVPAYGFAPSGKIVKQTHLLNTVDVSSTEAGHADDGKKPVDVARIGMKMVVQKPEAPAPVSSAYLPHPASGSVTVDFAFSADQVGMVAYVIFWYENPKGDNHSPESLALPITII